ncbi:MAG: hypothetical protein IPM06_19010 [Rhizobiales bacterium]|nr:hypothetical protein [Hyphomicrobiales bacterium]
MSDPITKTLWPNSKSSAATHLMAPRHAVRQRSGPNDTADAIRNGRSVEAFWATFVIEKSRRATPTRPGIAP